MASPQYASFLREVLLFFPDDWLVLEQQLEIDRLTQALGRLRQFKSVWQKTRRPSPLAFPLLVERLSARLSNESLTERVQRLKQQLEKR